MNLPAAPSRPVLSALSSARVAIVHEWFVHPTGSEAVVDAILALVPHAELFALVADVDGMPRGTYRGRPVRTSFIQRLPGGRDGFRRWLPLFPSAIERLDLRGYDVILSSSHCVAKGVRRRPGQLHLCYCHTPVRYAWDMKDAYLDDAGWSGWRRALSSRALDRLRDWDGRTTDRVDAFVANSAFVAGRIRRSYGRESTVIHPPVETSAFPLHRGARHGFVTASRLVPYKRVPLLVEAFAGLPDCPLTVIGAGPDRARAEQAAAGAPHIRFLGEVDRPLLADALGRAEAFVFAALEDFGIVPVEAQACGTPVLAYGAGGVCETVRQGETGDFFSEPTVEAVRAVVRRFRDGPPLDPAACRRQAERFDRERFLASFGSFVTSAWRAHRGDA